MRFCCLTILFVLSNFSAACFPESYVQELWNLFKSKYNRTYSVDEDYNRRATFNTTLNNVAMHNIEADLGLHSYTQAVNKFSDMSLEEFVNKYNVLPQTSSIIYVNVISEDHLAYLLPKNGPILVYLYASPSFSKYKAGIFSDTDCGYTPTHAGLAVGIGTENGIDFWRIKNSWGTDWGENGYFRMRRGVNMCGIAAAFNIQTQIELLPGLLI